MPFRFIDWFSVRIPNPLAQTKIIPQFLVSGLPYQFSNLRDEIHQRFVCIYFREMKTELDHDDTCMPHVWHNVSFSMNRKASSARYVYVNSITLVIHMHPYLMSYPPWLYTHGVKGVADFYYPSGKPLVPKEVSIYPYTINIYWVYCMTPMEVVPLEPASPCKDYYWGRLVALKSNARALHWLSIDDLHDPIFHIPLHFRYHAWIPCTCQVLSPFHLIIK